MALHPGLIFSAALAFAAQRPQDVQSSAFFPLGGLPGGDVASTALAISGNGKVVVGFSKSAQGTQAFRWEDGVMTPLARLSDFDTASAVSFDGAVIVGNTVTPRGTQAARWADNRGSVLAGMPDNAMYSTAWGVSADGSVIVGHLWLNNRDHAFVWKQSGEDKGGAGVVRLLTPNDSQRGSQLRPRVAQAVSADGSVIVGIADRGSLPEAFFARLNAQASGGHDMPALMALGDLRGGALHSTARCVSADGRVVAGSSDSAYGHEACRWDVGGQPPAPSALTPLGGLSDRHEFFSFARGVSADGSVIVGSSQGESSETEAFIWTASFGMRSVRDVLMSYAVGGGGGEGAATAAAESAVSLAGWSLLEATAVSHDGRSIVGYGKNPSGQVEGWLARLPDVQRPVATPAIFTAFESALSNVSSPGGVAISDDGTIYVAETGSDRVRMFDRQGNELRAPIRETMRLGTPRIGVVDPGTSPLNDIDSLKAPADLAVAHDGVVYILDSGNNRVVVRDAAGRSIAAWGAPGAGPGQFNRPQAIAVDEQRVYVADTGNDRVQIFSHKGAFLLAWGTSGHEPGQLRSPMGIAVREIPRASRSSPQREPAEGGTPQAASAMIFVADTGNDRIQMFTFAHDAQAVEGAGAARTDGVRSWGRRGRMPSGSRGAFFMNPQGLAYWNDRLYVADTGNHRIQVFDSNGNFIHAFGARAIRPHEAGGRLHFPNAIAIGGSSKQRDARGAAPFGVICESREDRCQVYSDMVKPSSSSPLVPIVSAPTPERQYFGPGIDVAGQLMAVVMPDGGTIGIWDISASPVLVAVAGEHGSRFGQLRQPAAVKIDPGSTKPGAARQPRLIVSDAGNRRLLTFEFNPGWIDSAGGRGGGRGGEAGAADSPSGAVQAKFIRSVDCAKRRDRMLPGDIELDRQGHVYVIDRSSRCVVKLDSDLSFLGVIGESQVAEKLMIDPVDMAIGSERSAIGDQRSGLAEPFGDAGLVPQDRLLVLDSALRNVLIFDLDGRLVGKWDRERRVAGGVGEGALGHPHAITVSPENVVYVSDDHRVLRFDMSGRYLARIGSGGPNEPGLAAGQFFKPRGLAIDDKLRLVVLDWGNHRAQIFSSDGESGRFVLAFGADIYVRPTIGSQE